MKAVITVSRYTFVELLKSKITYTSLILGIVILFISYISSEFTYGSPSIVALDIGIGFQSILSLAITLFVGVTLISEEINNRTIYMVLSRPISRESFVLGKILGLIGILVVNISILFLFSICTFLFLGGVFEVLIIHTFLMAIIEAIILLLIVLCFSYITSKTINLICSMTIFTVGHVVPNLLEVSFIKQNHGLHIFLNMLKYCLPSFDKFNIKEFVLYKNFLPPDYIINAYLYGISWIAFFIFLNFIIFKKIQFK